MPDSILQKFADNRFLNSIVKDEKDFASLQKASSLLVSYLKKKSNRSELIPYVLIGLNPNIDLNEPRLIIVEDFIKKKMNLFSSRSKDRPKSVIRAVILEALGKLASEDSVYDHIIWKIGKEYFPLISSNKEEEVLHEFLYSIGTDAEKNAIEKWKFEGEESLTPTIDISKVSFESVLSKIKAPKAITVNGSPPTTQVEVILSDSFNTWYTELLKSIDNNVLVNLQEQLNLTLKNAFENNVTNFHNRVLIRQELLWWKEALYSRTKNASYTEIESPIVCAMILAVDYSNIIQPICPESADHFLKQVLLSLNQSDDEISFSQILTVVVQQKDEMENVFEVENRQDGIISVVDFLVGLVNNVYSVNEFSKLTGIDNDKTTLVSDFSLMIFHQLQAKALIN